MIRLYRLARYSVYTRGVGITSERQNHAPWLSLLYLCATRQGLYTTYLLTCNLPATYTRKAHFATRGGDTVVAVLGAAHLNGVKRLLTSSRVV